MSILTLWKYLEQKIDHFLEVNPAMNPMGVFGIGLYPSDSRITRKRCGTPLDLEKKH